MPTEDRILSLYLAVKKILNQTCTARDYFHLLGLKASCIQIIPNARLFMRPIQINLLQLWKPCSQDLNKTIPFSQSLVPDLNWWLNPVNILKGRSVTPRCFTDILGWSSGKSNSSRSLDRNRKITTYQLVRNGSNWLEMEAVHRTIKHFLP
jgi:hypothetical protein